MTHADAARRKYRALLKGDACLFPGSVFDPMSARIAQDLGYEIGMFAGSVASMVVLGAPDIVMLTLTEFAEQCRRITRAAPALPLMVDADHGYGNALNVMRTVAELEGAGIAAMTIEDTELPPAFSAGGKGRLISLEEGVGKVKAALAARQSAELAIIGRTNLGLTVLEDGLARAKAYEAQGADAIFLVGIKAREQLDAFAAALKVPLMLGQAPADMADPAYLASRGVRVALQAHLPIRAAMQAVRDTLEAQRAGRKPDERALAPPELMKRLTREDDYDGWAKDFM